MDFLGSLHPKIIHFPIALFIIYTLLEIVGLIVKKEIFTKSAYIILILGILGAFAAVLTGNQAEEMWKNWTNVSKLLVEEHETYATITLWYFFGLTILRTMFVINVEIKKKFNQHVMKMKAAFVVLALIGCYFVYETGEHGGKLVYQHGVGISVDKQSEQIQNEAED